MYNLNNKTADTTFDTLIEEGKELLRNLGDGDISPSAYDTAWIARIPSSENPNQPMFPQALQWVKENQWSDGSWGTKDIEHYHDRVVCTLSCIVALRVWEPNSRQIERGENYIRENLKNLDTDSHATVGFELIFPELLSTAQKLGLDLPYDSPIIETIETVRQLKLSKIPIPYVYARPTTLLHSLEGLGDRIDCHKVLKHQADNGSFLNSPSATAFVYMNTGDENCLKYIQQMLDLFNGGAPVNYPIDLFERLWVLNNIYSLNLQRYFQEEIKPHIDYIENHWSEETGMVWSRYVQTPDIDDTAVAFKLLRLNGKDVSQNVFKNFYNGKNFFCFPGELDASLSHLISLRETALHFGEDLLDQAEQFTKNFLAEKLESNKLDDKWYYRNSNNTRDIVANTLSKKRFFNAPFIQKQKNIKLYRGTTACDYWIDKTIYTLPNVNSPLFLKIALEENDFVKQTFGKELKKLQNWTNAHLEGIHPNQVNSTYFIACNLAPEPDQGDTRQLLSKVSLWLFAIDELFNSDDSFNEQRTELISAFFQNDKTRLIAQYPDPEYREKLGELAVVIRGLLQEAMLVEESYIKSRFEQTIQEHLKKISHLGPSFDMDYARLSIGALLALELTYTRMSGLSQELLESEDYKYLLRTSDDILKILNDIKLYEPELSENQEEKVAILFTEFYETKMKELYQFCLDINEIPASYKMLAFDLCQTMASLYQESNFHEYKSNLLEFVGINTSLDPVQGGHRLHAPNPRIEARLALPRTKSPSAALFNFTLKMNAISRSFTLS